MYQLQQLNYKTSQEAWSKMNQFLATQENFLSQRQSMPKFGTQLIMYDTFIHIRKSWVDPEFNFGRMFGYKVQKWTHLVKNYVDMNYLDLVRNDILTREHKKSKNYSLSYHFANSHSNGKDCLISLIFSRRPGYDWPLLTFHTRATELTKRFLWDLLLIHRLGEYIYGEGSHFSVNFMAPYCFITAEAFTMFDTYKSIEKVMAKVENPGPFQQRILSTLGRYKVCDPLEIKYKSNRRAVLQLQTTEDGIALSKTKPLYAGDMYLGTRKRIEYPENCITEKQRNEFRKTLNIR